MGIMDQLKALKERAAQFVLEPERVDAWIDYLKECRVRAELEWTAKLEDVHTVHREGRTRFSSFSLGRIRLHGSAINHIEIIKASGSSSSSIDVIGMPERTHTKMVYEDHFLIDVPERGPIDPPRARRKPKKAYWIFGRVLEYRWRGGRFAEILASDATLNKVLAEEGEEKIHIGYDRGRNCICIGRPYIGMTIDTKSGLIRHSTELSRHYNFPSQEAFKAYEHIARKIRDYAGLPDS